MKPNFVYSKKLKLPYPIMIPKNTLSNMNIDQSNIKFIFKMYSPKQYTLDGTPKAEYSH